MYVECALLLRYLPSSSPCQGNTASYHHLRPTYQEKHIFDIAKSTTYPRHWVLWPLVQSRSFNNNLGQTSVWFCLAKGKKYIEFDKSIINFNKSITFFLVSSLNNFDKSWQRAVTERLTRHRQCHRLTICFLFISDLTNSETVAATPSFRWNLNYFSRNIN